jgi:hypothetical protein
VLVFKDVGLNNCLFITRPEASEWLNSSVAYVCCLTLPICGLLPLADKTGYGLVNNIWCAALIDTIPGKHWLIVCYIFIYSTIALMIGVFVLVAVRLRAVADVDILWKVSYGVGGYVAITILIWLPRVALLQHTSNVAFLVIRLLPDVSAVLYAMLYFWRRLELYQFEEIAADVIRISAQMSIDSITGGSSGRTTDITVRGSDSVQLSTCGILAKVVSNPLVTNANMRPPSDPAADQDWNNNHRNMTTATLTVSVGQRESDAGVGVNSVRMIYDL